MIRVHPQPPALWSSLDFISVPLPPPTPPIAPVVSTSRRSYYDTSRLPSPLIRSEPHPLSSTLTSRRASCSTSLSPSPSLCFPFSSLQSVSPLPTYSQSSTLSLSSADNSHNLSLSPVPFSFPTPYPFPIKIHSPTPSPLPICTSPLALLIPVDHSPPTQDATTSLTHSLFCVRKM